MEERFGEFSKIRESENHSSMSWGQFNDSFCYLCLAASVVASWPHTQEDTSFLNLIFLSVNFCENT